MRRTPPRVNALRVTPLSLSYWSKYYLPPMSMPKMNGPPPKEAPQSFNSTKAIPFIDRTEDAFPKTIRGNMVMPDVPLEHNYIKPWYILRYEPTSLFKDVLPWSSQAKDGAFRFRKWPEFDNAGASSLASLMRHRHATTGGGAVVRDGSARMLHKESYLSAISAGSRPKRLPSPSLLLDRAIRKHFIGLPSPTPLEQQRDVGRVEEPHPAAHKVPVSSHFPFRWNTRDWYTHEVAAVRQRRFFIENDDAAGGEVTYKLVIQSVWDEHVKAYAEDLHRFFNDLGRQVVEEKLAATRKSLDTMSVATLPPQVLAAAKAEGLGDDEAVHFATAELRQLEEQCVRLLTLANSGVAHADIYDPSSTWPHVEQLQAWKRMFEFWSKRADETFAQAEISTRKYEFERFFRVVVVKLPFHSAHFERRVFDTVHWAHRRCGVEIHTVAKKNVVHDGSMYPTEHEAATPVTHAAFGPLSFALDWTEAPAAFIALATVLAGDTWSKIAERVGCAEAELLEANDAVASTPLPKGGASVWIPRGASKRLVSFQRSRPVTVDLTRGGKVEAPKTWDDVAAALNCSVGELKALNAAHASAAAPPSSLVVPIDETENSEAAEFSPTEPVYSTDTAASIAARLGCTEEALRATNPSVTNFAEVHDVAVPQSATRRRRVLHPLRDTTNLFERSTVEAAEQQLPATFPTAPANAQRFPMEYGTEAEALPKTPAIATGTEDWLAYTARHLDGELSVKAAPAPRYSTNPAWPAEVVPGEAEQTPFQEDHTWMFNEQPLQKKEVQHTHKYLQDLPEVNHELLAQSLEWQAP